MTLQDLKRAERYAHVVRDTTKAMYESAQKAVDDLEEAIRKAEREEEKRVPWEEAPEWAQWAAMDRCGMWQWFQNEPLRYPTHWAIGEGRSIALNHHRVADWTRSKQRRPE